MDVSIIVPAYNESKRIVFTLDKIAEYFGISDFTFEIIVVDDGSSDDTAAKVNEWVRTRRRENFISPAWVTSIYHQGKGGAVIRGVMESSGRWVLITDADLSTPLEEWPKLARALEDGATIAAGSRQAPGADVRKHQPWFRQSLGLMFGRLVRLIFPLDIKDTQCGFKAFDAKAARQIFSQVKTRGYCFDVEALLRARALGYSIAEVPVIWTNNPDSSVRVWRDWPGILKELLAILRDKKDFPRESPGEDLGQ